MVAQEEMNPPPRSGRLPLQVNQQPQAFGHHGAPVKHVTHHDQMSFFEHPIEFRIHYPVSHQNLLHSQELPMDVADGKNLFRCPELIPGRLEGYGWYGNAQTLHSRNIDLKGVFILESPGDYRVSDH